MRKGSKSRRSGNLRRGLAVGAVIGVLGLTWNQLHDETERERVVEDPSDSEASSGGRPAAVIGAVATTLNRVTRAVLSGSGARGAQDGPAPESEQETASRTRAMVELIRLPVRDADPIVDSPLDPTTPGIAAEMPQVDTPAVDTEDESRPPAGISNTGPTGPTGAGGAAGRAGASGPTGSTQPAAGADVDPVSGGSAGEPSEPVEPGGWARPNYPDSGAPDEA